MPEQLELKLGAAHIPVLDHGYVEFVESWGSDERIIEAARMSTDKGFQGWESDEKLLKFLYKHNHLTPFEMCGAIFEVKAPLMVFREWHRHRTQGFNEMSARYIPLPDENYVPDPEDLVKRANAAALSKNRQATGTGTFDERTVMNDLHLLRLHYVAGQDLYEGLLERGWPKELARLVVPVARYSKMRVTCNLRNWMHFLRLRLDPNAQQEIRLYAEAVCNILASCFPRTIHLFLDDVHGF